MRPDYASALSTTGLGAQLNIALLNEGRAMDKPFLENTRLLTACIRKIKSVLQRGSPAYSAFKRYPD